MDPESLGCTEHFDTKFEFLERRNPCKSAFQSKLFEDVSDPAGYSFPFGPWNYIYPVVFNRAFALLCCTVYAVPNDRENKRNVGNDKGGNEQYDSSFQAYINK